MEREKTKYSDRRYTEKECKRLQNEAVTEAIGQILRYEVTHFKRLAEAMKSSRLKAEGSEQQQFYGKEQAFEIAAEDLGYILENPKKYLYEHYETE